MKTIGFRVGVWALLAVVTVGQAVLRADSIKPKADETAEERQKRYERIKDIRSMLSGISDDKDKPVVRIPAAYESLPWLKESLDELRRMKDGTYGKEVKTLVAPAVIEQMVDTAAQIVAPVIAAPAVVPVAAPAAIVVPAVPAVNITVPEHWLKENNVVPPSFFKPLYRDKLTVVPVAPLTMEADLESLPKLGLKLDSRFK